MIAKYLKECARLEAEIEKLPMGSFIWRLLSPVMYRGKEMMRVVGLLLIYCDTGLLSTGTVTSVEERGEKKSNRERIKAREKERKEIEPSSGITSTLR